MKHIVVVVLYCIEASGEQKLALANLPINAHLNQMNIELELQQEHSFSILYGVITKTCGFASAQTTLSANDLKSALIILNTTVDVIHDTDEKISKLQYIRQDSVNTAPFEVGYLTYTLQEKYRKMVDKFNTSTYMKQRLYLMELVIILEEIERHYWQVEHISNMMHEIERKYKIQSGLHEKYDNASHGAPTHYHGKPTVHSTTKRKRLKINKYLEERMKATTPKTHKKWWDLDYGWEIDYYW